MFYNIIPLNDIFLLNLFDLLTYVSTRILIILNLLITTYNPSGKNLIM